MLIELQRDDELTTFPSVSICIGWLVECAVYVCKHDCSDNNILPYSICLGLISNHAGVSCLSLSMETLFDVPASIIPPIPVQTTMYRLLFNIFVFSQ